MNSFQSWLVGNLDNLKLLHITNARVVKHSAIIYGFLSI
jgi:hypothetical protein